MDKLFVVGSLSYFDNDMKLKKVKAKNWREAVIAAFPDMGFVTEEPDLECALEMAFNSDNPIQVIEI